MQARELFLSLESNPVAPDDDFDRFVVGSHFNDSFIKLRVVTSEMIKGKQPSRFQLVVGENGNGKTLLANRLTRFLSDENETRGPKVSGQSERKFDVLYSHISALGKASSQTSLEIVTNLRRSDIEEPELTYSLIAAKIAGDFAMQYQPPILWRFLKLLGRGTADFFTGGFYGKLEEALRDKSAQQIRSALEGVNERFQKSLNNTHYRKKFEEFIGDLVAFEPFVNTYFNQSSGAGINRLRANFLAAVNGAPSLAQPEQAIAQIIELGKRINTKAVVIIIDDCNQLGFVEQLLPLINDLSKFTTTKVFLMVNMVQSVAEEIVRSSGDQSVPQRLFYNDPIRLLGPSRKEVDALYDNLRVLYNEAFSESKAPVPESPVVREKTVNEWSDAVVNGRINSNYRDAVRLLIQRLKSP